MPGPTAEAFRRFSPLRPDPIERRQEDEHHEWDLEVGINEDQSAELVQPDAVGIEVDSVLLQPEGDKASAADGGDEGKCERDAPELGQHSTGRYHQTAQ